MVGSVPQGSTPPMNAFIPAGRGIPLVDVIDLKWLLAGEGIHLHVEKLQNDPAYAAEVLAQAARSGNEALRGAGEKLARLLQSGS
jgi:hypothetical protein